MPTSTWRTLFRAPAIEAVTPLLRVVLPGGRTPVCVRLTGWGRLQLGNRRQWFWGETSKTFLIPAAQEVTIRVSGLLGRSSRRFRVEPTTTATLDTPAQPRIAHRFIAASPAGLQPHIHARVLSRPLARQRLPEAVVSPAVRPLSPSIRLYPTGGLVIRFASLTSRET